MADSFLRLTQKSSTGLQKTLNSNYEISIHPDEKVLIIIKINTVLKALSASPLFLFTCESLPIIFHSERMNGNHCETTKDNLAHFQEHNRP